VPTWRRAHDQASRANELANWDELTARCDWYYEDEAPPTHAGAVKHVAMFVWSEDASEADKQAALDAVEGLAETDQVEAVLTGHNVGKLTTDYDWTMDLRVADRAAAERLLGGDDYRRAMRTVAKATRFEWTARMSHVMHRP
jgi:hypothetical protein